MIKDKYSKKGDQIKACPCGIPFEVVVGEGRRQSKVDYAYHFIHHLPTYVKAVKGDNNSVLTDLGVSRYAKL